MFRCSLQIVLYDMVEGGQENFTRIMVCRAMLVFEDGRTYGNGASRLEADDLGGSGGTRLLAVNYRMCRSSATLPSKTSQFYTTFKF